MRRLLALALVIALVVGVAALFVPSDTLAKGKPKPPPCPCAPTIGLCVLEACGSDCVYVCPFPFP